MNKKSLEKLRPQLLMRTHKKKTETTDTEKRQKHG